MWGNGVAFEGLWSGSSLNLVLASGVDRYLTIGGFPTVGFVVWVGPR